ncbi:UNVERIFIED_CONTAM: hypothetical protein Sradi_1303500 [Sesamum radiatum]|uniref:Retrotransposon gag domain-containing protein n=1 Tax=Sesamum radiatum TaxID=300843 RepID=A0AAW2UNH8_SESRA
MTVKNLKTMVMEELPQFVEKRMVSASEDVNCLTESAKERKNFLWDMESYFQEVLKKELNDQFLPCNISWVARESLWNLRHMGTIHEFAKEFSSLMLDVRDILEEDKLFNFIAGLQPCAPTKLMRQGAMGMPSAIVVSDRLVDFRVMEDPK